MLLLLSVYLTVIKHMVLMVILLWYSNPVLQGLQYFYQPFHFNLSFLMKRRLIQSVPKKGCNFINSLTIVLLFNLRSFQNFKHTHRKKIRTHVNSNWLFSLLSLWLLVLYLSATRCIFCRDPRHIGNIRQSPSQSFDFEISYFGIYPSPWFDIR